MSNFVNVYEACRVAISSVKSGQSQSDACVCKPGEVPVSCVAKADSARACLCAPASVTGTIGADRTQYVHTELSTGRAYNFTF